MTPILAETPDNLPVSSLSEEDSREQAISHILDNLDV
jgi:hypothetical protein